MIPPPQQFGSEYFPFVLKESDNELHFSFILPAGNDFTINPIQFKDALISDFSPEKISWSIVRKKLLVKDGTEFR